MHWLTFFELFVDAKGLIITETTNANTRQQRIAMLPHLAGPDIQKLFSTLMDTGKATDYTAAVTALNGYFLPKPMQLSSTRNFSDSNKKKVRPFCSLLLNKEKKELGLQFWFRQPDNRRCPV